MKKYIIGGIVGFMLSIGISAHAEVVNMIGKVVDGSFAVKVGDKALTTPAITIEGMSYLPVREFGEATGYNVTFDADLGITMIPKPITPQPFKPKPILQVQNITKVTFNGKESTLEGYIEMDGNKYVPLAALIDDNYSVTFKDPNAVVSVKGQSDISINVRNDYQTNIDGFQYQGTSYVKLSALGLTAHVDGDTLFIDKQ